ncbi:MAG: hypothetical protein ACRD0K_05980 [Egibacteraceae bacterium]
MSATRSEPPILPGGLRLDEDPEGHRRARRAGRVSWALMAALIVAALLGLFGPGPLSHTEAAACGFATCGSRASAHRSCWRWRCPAR